MVLLIFVRVSAVCICWMSASLKSEAVETLRLSKVFKVFQNSRPTHRLEFRHANLPP